MSINFTDLQLNKALLSAINDTGFTEPTPVQLATIPEAINNQDLTVCAQTGSGKTAAFLLPSLNKIMAQKSSASGKGPRILVLTPTRELAQQVEQNAITFTKYIKNFKSITLIGGSSYRYQTKALASPIDLLIATPGRLIDLMRQGYVDFNRLEVLILDEADRMLDMGFIDDIKTIVKATPESRQTLLFSATLDGMTEKLAKSLTKTAKHIEIDRVAQQGKIKESIYYVNDFRHKIRILDYLILDPAIFQAVIFTSTKAMSEQLANELYHKGHKAQCLHGDMPQNARVRTLKNLHRKQIKFLVATDVAARGIDVASITHVINFDLPKQAEDYVHRIGRTGRAGREGTAITFAEVNEYPKIHKMEKYLQRKIQEVTIEGMEPTKKKATPKAKRNFTAKSKPFHKKASANPTAAKTSPKSARSLNNNTLSKPINRKKNTRTSTFKQSAASPYNKAR